MNKIPTICYEDVYEFCEAVDNEFEKYLDKAIKKDGTVDIVVIAKYKNAREIINVLVDYGYEIANVNIHDSMVSGYSDEYIVSLCYGLNNSDTSEIWCEPAKNDKGYLLNEGDVVYIFDECNSKVVPQVESDRTYFVELEDDFEDEFAEDLEVGNCDCLYDYDCESCPEYDDEDVKEDEYVNLKLTRDEMETLHMLCHIFDV